MPVKSEREPCANVPSDDGDCSLWASKIASAWQSTLERIILTGKLLLAAHAAIDFSQWLLFIRSDLPFKERTAQRLMAIARDERITNTTHAPHLPTSWPTLYILTQLSDAWFQWGLECHAIHPEMTRADAEKLLKRQEIENATTGAEDGEECEDHVCTDDALTLAREAYFAECKKLTVRAKGRELRLCFNALALSDEDQIASRRSRHADADVAKTNVAATVVAIRKARQSSEEGSRA